MRSNEWALILSDSCPYKKNPYNTETCVHKKITLGRDTKREALEEINPASTLILDCRSPKQWNNKFLVFKPSSLWYFVIAALDN